MSIENTKPRIKDLRKGRIFSLNSGSYCHDSGIRLTLNQVALKILYSFAHILKNQESVLPGATFFVSAAFQ